MADEFNLQHRFDQLIEMNDQAFQNGYLDVAYHALVTAFACAKEMGSDPLISKIGSLAEGQLAWIDENQSNYKHSTRSAAERHGGLSIYRHLSNQAGRTIGYHQTLLATSKWMEK